MILTQDNWLFFHQKMHLGEYPLLTTLPHCQFTQAQLDVVRTSSRGVFFKTKKKSFEREQRSERGATHIHFITFVTHGLSVWNESPSPPHLHVFPDFTSLLRRGVRVLLTQPCSRHPRIFKNKWLALCWNSRLYKSLLITQINTFGCYHRHTLPCSHPGISVCAMHNND